MINNAFDDEHSRRNAAQSTQRRTRLRWRIGVLFALALTGSLVYGVSSWLNARKEERDGIDQARTLAAHRKQLEYQKRVAKVQGPLIAAQAKKIQDANVALFKKTIYAPNLATQVLAASGGSGGVIVEYNNAYWKLPQPKKDAVYAVWYKQWTKILRDHPQIQHNSSFLTCSPDAQLRQRYHVSQ